MEDPTKKANSLSDDEQFEKDTERFQEIKKKPDTERTDDEKKEFGDLKERYGKRMQKKIDQMSWETKTAKEEAEAARREADEARQKAKELEDRLGKAENKAPIKETYVEIGGKKYLTDEALLEKINAGDITEQEAVRYQKQRDKEEIKQEIRQEQQQDDQKKTVLQIAKKDAEEVIEKYPYFKKDHPDFNPEDPLYKLTLELYAEGYAANPKGLSLAVKRAEQLLKINRTPIDRGGDFEISDNEAPAKKGGGEKEITLSEAEKEAGIRMYTRGDVLNPKTGRVYTANEAIAKALAAKKARINR